MRISKKHIGEGASFYCPSWGTIKGKIEQIKNGIVTIRYHTAKHPWDGHILFSVEGYTAYKEKSEVTLTDGTK